MIIDPQEVLACGELCELLYCDRGPGTSLDDLRWATRPIGHAILVGFRGTANTKNAIRDITILPPKKQDGYLAHRGFARATEKLIPMIDTLRLKEDTDIIFTGHSFGGAVAAHMAHHYGKRAITFGCPATHFWFAPWPNINHLRVVCDDDPVPKVPLLLGKHTCSPGLVLRDKDHQWIDVEDHRIAEYNKRLKIWAGIPKT